MTTTSAAPTTAPVDALVASLPDGVVTTDPAALERYRHDWSKDDTAGTPVAAVRAECAEHVQVALRWATEHGVPVVPRGAGSGLSGGSSALDGGIVREPGADARDRDRRRHAASPSSSPAR